MGALEDFVVRLFFHVAPALKEQNIVLDRTHRAGHPARTPGEAQDIPTYQGEAIMATVCNTASIEFEGHRIGWFQDLSMLTLQRRRALRPVMDLLRENGIRYKWGHPFHLHFTWQNETLSIRTLEEAQGLDGMPLCLRHQIQQSAPQVQSPRADGGCPKTHTRQNTSHKPTMVESHKERAALLRSLRISESGLRPMI
ncbi:hypothetical protein NDU88_006283 [Pleurodeles waltl]|uniref:Uncharacterized protein n=1 Tax=Pleurodeles waltl TaxID=8319 RepID=A0AAV7TWP1_PLEWA|nr:hypothetical protein NDU88_006283 [Pleurodeles waltl]